MAKTSGEIFVLFARFARMQVIMTSLINYEYCFMLILNRHSIRAKVKDCQHFEGIWRAKSPI